jgi:hypothetical protein
MCLQVSAAALAAAGGFCLIQSSLGVFLPHDEAFLGMNARDLCSLQQCRIVHFMIHDRVAFGGVLIAIAMLYEWLTEVPLGDAKQNSDARAWAWWVLAISGAAGFLSFLTYLGYGYLDTWHGASTLLLLPWFALGLGWTAPRPLPAVTILLRPTPWAAWPWTSTVGRGRALMLLVALGMTGAGLVIMSLGILNIVFVPEDLRYLGLTRAELDAINPRLIPLIAHDRAGFGGALFCCGITIGLVIWKASPTRRLWNILGLAGAVGFGCALGIHYPIGYIDFQHLAPAWAGAIFSAAALLLLYPIRAVVK